MQFSIRPRYTEFPASRNWRTLAVGWSAAGVATAQLLRVLDDGIRDDLRSYVVVGLGSPDAPLHFGERLQVCLLAADQTGWSAQMG
jgi:hypothetical protein